MFRTLGSLSGGNMNAILAWLSILVFSLPRVARVCVEPKSMPMMITAMTLQNGRRRGNGRESANAFDQCTIRLHCCFAAALTRGIPRISAIIRVPRSHCRQRTHTKIQICIRATTYRIIHSQIILKQIFSYGDRKGRKGAKRNSRAAKECWNRFAFFSISPFLCCCRAASWPEGGFKSLF